MISLTYAEFAAIDGNLARRLLLEVYHDSGGNVSQTATEFRVFRETERRASRRDSPLGRQPRTTTGRDEPRPGFLCCRTLRSDTPKAAGIRKAAPFCDCDRSRW
jgi:hypothetical protein